MEVTGKPMRGMGKKMKISRKGAKKNLLAIGHPPQKYWSTATNLFTRGTLNLYFSRRNCFLLLLELALFWHWIH